VSTKAGQLHLMVHLLNLVESYAKELIVWALFSREHCKSHSSPKWAVLWCRGNRDFWEQFGYSQREAGYEMRLDAIADQLKRQTDL
jgi:hypothetical protein